MLRAMKIGALLLVKDDIDLLRRNLAHHYEVGVDCFVICDRGSGPTEQLQLEELAERDNVHLFRQHLYDLPEITRSTMRAARLAALEEMRSVFAPDWFFPVDTDEFWIPRSGDLKETFEASGFEHLHVDRFNAALKLEEPAGLLAGQGGIAQGAQPLLGREILVGRKNLTPQLLENEPETPWVFAAVMSKFATSRKDFVAVHPGFHDVELLEKTLGARPKDLLIYHLPFTSLERFAHKVEGVRRHIDRIGPTFRGDRGWHWKRLAAIDSDQDLKTEFERQFFSESELRDLRSRGVVKSIDGYFSDLDAGSAGVEATPSILVSD